MKKNKTIAYMLAATLLVGGTFLGTKALFTDVENSIGELAISTGDVDIEIVDNENVIPSGWILTRNGSELADGTTVGGDKGEEGQLPDGGDVNNTCISAFANNLKPGDSLTKKVTVKNVGTLKAQLEVLPSQNMDVQLGALQGLVSVDQTLNDEDKVLAPGESTTIDLTLTVNTDIEQPHNESLYNTNDVENQIINLKNAWILSATQQNVLQD